MRGKGFTVTVLVGVLAGGLALHPAWAEEQATGTAVEVPRRRPVPPSAAKPVTAVSWQSRYGKSFQRKWGVDIVGVRRVASGSMLRFDYRVLDPDRASALIDKKARAYLIDEATRTALAVPAMENVGELRQVAPLEAHRTYFVIFGNPGGLVKRGGRVTLVVGDFRAEGLVVQ